MAKERKAYPSDVSDEEWEFCAPYLTLMTGKAPQRKFPLREIFKCAALVYPCGLSLAHAAQ